MDVIFLYSTTFSVYSFYIFFIFNIENLIKFYFVGFSERKYIKTHK